MNDLERDKALPCDRSRNPPGKEKCTHFFKDDEEAHKWWECRDYKLIEGKHFGRTWDNEKVKAKVKKEKVVQINW